jgi:4-amino-4-deoxy-L-arabinose transferase-like glycosyltransferase
LKSEINTKHLVFFILACLAVFLPGLLVDVMNIDAAQYASMSREMTTSKNWLEVYCHGDNYLDKPPLLFWLSAISFKIFGFSNLAYKLPSFLFAILGVYSTAKIGELLYDKKTGILAALMLVFSFGMFVMTNDIRTDTILLGATIFSTWQLLLYLKTKRFISLVLGFAGVGVAMLAKGPLGFILPVAALSCDFAYKRQWRNFFRWQWLVGIVIVGIFLFPMCYGLYQQFDLHPEKIVDGHQNVSGLRFYFWTQSFGRITGESDWGTKLNNGAGPFFFTHTFMWVFFPWSFFLIGGLVKNFAVLIKSKFKAGYLHELLSTGGFVLVFIALSASRYKLPHYVYVLLPMASIISSRFLLHDIIAQEKKGLFRLFSGLNWIFFFALAGVCSFLLFIVFPGASFLTILATYTLFLTGILVAWKYNDSFRRLIYPLLTALLAFYFVGGTHFYPQLLKYQSGNEAGKIIAEQNVPSSEFYTLNFSDHALDFYSGLNPGMLNNSDSLRIQKILSETGKLWIFSDAEGEAMIRKYGYKIISEKEFQDFHVQFLTMPFLLPDSRKESLKTKYLLELSI